jgi:hypothetical protein
MNPKAIGEVSEGVVLALLIKRGHPVLIPFGNNQRYDLVVDLGEGRFERVQVKTARIRNGCVTFKTSSVNGFTGARRDYANQADAFYAYCPDDERVYRVPVGICGKSMVTLRVAPARGGPSGRIRLASDFVV